MYIRGFSPTRFKTQLSVGMLALSVEMRQYVLKPTASFFGSTVP
jgi:hypothetical protein